MKNKKIFLLVTIFMFSTILIGIQPVMATETELLPVEDAYVNSFFSDTNYGASDYLSVGCLIWGDDITFLKFDIPLSGKTIKSATIKTYWYNFMLTSRMDICAGTTSNDWDENTITWDNAPRLYYEIIASKLMGDGEWFNFGVLDYITEGESFSVIIWEDGDSGQYLQVDSRESGFSLEPTILIIVYETTIEDFIPFIIIGVVIVCAIGGTVGIVIHLKHKKEREQEERRKAREIKRPEENPYRVKEP